MEVDFPRSSPVGRLWEDIQKLAQSQRIPKQTLEKSIDVGYVEDPHYIPAKFQTIGKISAGEVLEYAYRFKDYYLLLNKHGFPVPFVLDDFDPKTGEDAKTRAQIRTRIQKIKSELTKDPRLLPGSDAYLMAMGKRIFDWQVDTFKDFSIDGRRELAAWQALQMKGGECTEKSSILYDVYQKAGLNPVFFLLYNIPPTLANYYGASENVFKEGHVFIGFFLPEQRRWLYVDPSVGWFDADYPNPIALTPRQYVQGAYLSNQYIAAAEKGDLAQMEVLTNQGGQLGPLSLFSFTQSFLVMMNIKGEEEFEDWFKQHQSLFQFYPGVQRDLELLAETGMAIKKNDLAGHLGAVEKRMEALKEIAPRYPYYSALNYYGIYNALRSLTQGNPFFALNSDNFFSRQLRLYAKNALLASLEANPNFMASYWELAKVVREDPSLFPEVFAFLHDIAEKNSRHAVAHHLAADLGFAVVADKFYRLTETEMKKIEEHVRALTQLEPDHVETLRLNFYTFLFRGDLPQGIRYFEEKLQGRDDIPFRIYAEAGSIYLARGDYPQAKQQLRKFFDLSVKKEPHLFLAWLLGMSQFSPKTAEEEDEKRTQIKMDLDEGMRHHLRFFDELAQWLAPFPDRKVEMDIFYARLLFLALVDGKKESLQFVKRRLDGKLSAPAQGRLQQDFSDLLDQLAKKKEMPDTGINKAEKFLAAFRPWLAPEEEGLALLAKAYLLFARFSIQNQNYQRARILFQKAMQTSALALDAENYGNQILREFYDVLAKNPQDPKSLQQLWFGLELAYPHRKKLSETVLKMLTIGYSELHTRHAELGQKGRAALAEQRGRNLK